MFQNDCLAVCEVTDTMVHTVCFAVISKA